MPSYGCGDYYHGYTVTMVTLYTWIFVHCGWETDSFPKRVGPHGNNLMDEYKPGHTSQDYLCFVLGLLAM